MTTELIDVSGFAHRAFHSLDPVLNRNGTNIAPLKALAEITKQKPDAVYVLEGENSRGYRQKILPSYKSNRKNEPEKRAVLEKVKPLLIKTGVKIMQAPMGFEADDLIADMVKEPGEFIIVSQDKDFLQVLSDNPSDKKVQIWDPVKKIFKNALFCMSRFGVKPSEFIFYQALVGDQADCIPGVKGIGPVAATKIIKECKGDPETLDENWEWFAEKFPKLKSDDAVVHFVASSHCVRLGVRSK